MTTAKDYIESAIVLAESIKHMSDTDRIDRRTDEVIFELRAAARVMGIELEKPVEKN